MELKSCPFCGGDARAFDNGVGYDPRPWAVWCQGEGCAARMHDHYATKAEAIAAWNRRALPEGERIDKRDYLQAVRAFTWLLRHHGPVEISLAAIVAMPNNMKIVREDGPDSIRFAAIHPPTSQSGETE